MTQQNVAHDQQLVSPSVPETKIRYSRLIFDDNEVKLICSSIQQHVLTVSVCYTQVIWRVRHL